MYVNQNTFLENTHVTVKNMPDGAFPAKWIDNLRSS